MDWSSAETEKGTVDHESPQPSLLPVDSSGDQDPSELTSPDTDLGGMSSTTQIVSCSPTVTQIDKENGPTVSKTDDDKLSGDCPATTIAISAPESASSQSRVGDADDTPMEEPCDQEAGWQITAEDTADEVTQDTTAHGDQSAWDNEADSDRPPLPGCAEEVEMRSGREEEMSVMEVTSTNSGDMLPDHDPDQSDSEAAGQCQGDSAMEQSQTPHNQDSESTVEIMHGTNNDESEPTEMQAESESIHSDSAVSLRMETDCYDETVEENQNESSCSPPAGKNDDDDSGDDSDVITLSEEDFNMPCFVISDVRSMTDDGIYFDEGEEGDTGIYVTAEHQSDSAESTIAGEKIQDCLPEVSSNIQPQKPAHEETDTENRPSGHCQEPLSSPPTSAPIPQASSHAVQNTAESGTEPVADIVRSSTPPSKKPEGNAAELSDRTRSSELVAKTTEQEDNSSTEREGPSSSTHKRRKDWGDRESLVVKLEVEDTGYDTGPAVPSVPGSTAQCATSTAVTLGASSTRKRPHSEVETDPEGDKTDGSKRRAFEVSCSEEGGSVLHVPEEGNSGSAEDSQAGKGRAGTAADTGDGPASQAGGQPQRTVLLNTLRKSLVLPPNFIIKKSVKQLPGKATRRVVLTIPYSLGLGGKTTSAIQFVKGPHQKISSQTESSVSSDVAKHSVTQPPTLTHCSSTASGSSRPHTAQRTYQGQSVRLGSLLNHPITMQAKSASEFVSLLPSVKSNKNPVKHPGIPKAGISSQPTQTVKSLLTSLRSGSVPANSSTTVTPKPVSTTQKSQPTQRVQSLLTSFSSASVPANSSTTVPQTPVTTSQKSASTVVRVGPQQAVAAKQDVVRTSQSAVGSTETLPVNPAVSNTTPPSAGTGAQTPQAVIVQNIAPTNACQTTTPSKAVIIQAIAPTDACDTTTSNIRVDQVSAGAKLAADDMIMLIEGKNLVPPPDILPRPGKSKSLNSTYRCVECSVNYSSLVGYNAHVKRMSMVIQYACMACEAALVFFNKCTFLAHIRRHTTGRVLSLKSYMMTVSSLPRELLPPVEVQFMSPIHTSRTEPLKCTECNKTFPLPSSLATHFSAVGMCTFEHTCQYCSMELPTACALKAHLRLHDSNPLHTLCASAPYVCPECGVQYANQLSLYQHLFATCLHFSRCISMHCFACTDSFPTLKTLEDHIYISHKNKKRYRCLKCNLLYRNSLAFLTHIPEVHKDEDKAWSRTESSCTYCTGDWMVGREHARSHVESVKKPTLFWFACPFCTNCRFLHSRQLLVHLNQSHGAYKFTCTICKQGFVTLSLLRVHILSYHSVKNSKDPNSPGEMKISCRVCTATTLHSESALPHIMWHVLKKITDVTDSEETSTEHSNKQSMACVVSDSLKDTTKGYLCRMCGLVCSSSMELHDHMVQKKKSACSQFPACSYCLCYSRDKVTRYRCSATCPRGVGNREGGDQGLQEERPLDTMSSETPPDDDNDSNSKTGSELDEQTQAGSSGQNTQQLIENSTPSGNSNVEKRRISPSCIVVHVLNEKKGKGTLSSSSRRAADGKSTGSTVREGSFQKDVTSSGAGGRPSLVLRHKSATSLLSGQLSPGGSNTSTCSDLSECSAADKSGGETKEKKSVELRYKGKILICRKRKLKRSRETDFDFSVTPEEADSQPLYHPCHLCGLTYASADQLASHRASVHRGEKTVLSCPVCEKKGKTLMLSKNLKRHLVRKHNLAKPVAETVAAREASQAAHKYSIGTEASSPPTPGDDAVKRLRIAEDDQQEYVCAKCKFSSPSMSEFRGHIAVHAVENSVQCLECGLCFSAVRSLKKHLFMVHKVKQPDAYIAEHDIKLEALPEDLVSEMDTLAPFTQPEVVIRKAGVFVEGLLRPQPYSQAPPERLESTRRSSSNMLECTVCYRDFESEALLRSHMRTHGMAFIRSRRALPRQEGRETGAEERGDMADLGDQQTESIQVD